MSLERVTAFRLDKETELILEDLSKLTKISKSELVRMALTEFIKNAYQNEEYPIFKRYLAYQKIKSIEKEIKQIRYIQHMKRNCERWIKTIDKAINGEIKNVTSNSYLILNTTPKNILLKLRELEEDMIKAIKDYENLVNVGITNEKEKL